MPADRPPGFPLVRRSGVRLARWAAGLVTGSGTVAGIAWTSLHHPGLLRLADLTALGAVGGPLVILAAALLGPDGRRSPFERLMSFAGLLLGRAPEKYVLLPPTHTDQALSPVIDTVSPWERSPEMTAPKKPCYLSTTTPPRIHLDRPRPARRRTAPERTGREAELLTPVHARQEPSFPLQFLKFLFFLLIDTSLSSRHAPALISVLILYRLPCHHDP